MNPLEFQGDIYPLKSLDWLIIIEMIFEMTQCNKEDKVVCVIQMFRGPATS